MQRVETDILVVGGGSAGICAALAARAAGLRVALAYKTGGNCTSVAAGGFAAVMPGVEDDAPRRHGENTLRSSGGLADARLVEALVERAAAALQNLMSWGVEFSTLEDGSLRRFRSGGHDRARTYRCRNGNLAQCFRTLSRRVRDSGVELLKDCMAVGLLRHGARVCGAWGMDREGRPLQMAAKAVVLATGGFPGIYQHRTAPAALTGEGQVMAYEAGARLMDLEFVQFMPTTIAFPPEFHGRVVNDTLRGEGAVLRNSKNERFMARYAPAYGDLAGRDILAISIATEVAQGRGTPHGGVYLDATALDERTIFESFGWARQLAARGIDLRSTYIEVTPAAHFTCGGIGIDEHCATGVEGLFAAGECAGGIHGANRLGANALTATLVFGDIAGRSAARFAAGVAGPEAAADPVQTRMAEESLPPVLRKNAALDALEEEIRKIFWERMGVVRTRDGLAEAVSRLRGLEASLAAERPGGYTYAENMRRLRVRKMALLGRMVAQAAEERRESRGNHCRLDFPETDAAFARHRVFADTGRP